MLRWNVKWCCGDMQRKEIGLALSGYSFHHLVTMRITALMELRLNRSKSCVYVLHLPWWKGIKYKVHVISCWLNCFLVMYSTFSVLIVLSIATWIILNTTVLLMQVHQHRLKKYEWYLNLVRLCLPFPGLELGLHPTRVWGHRMLISTFDWAR